jgi:hypothetical protein
MKTKNLIYLLMMGILLSGLIAAGFISVHNKEKISKQINQNQFQIPQRYNPASISKGTILLLLAVGVIGVLGVKRKKKEPGNPAQKNEISREPDNHNLNEDKKNL